MLCLYKTITPAIWDAIILVSYSPAVHVIWPFDSFYSVQSDIIFTINCQQSISSWLYVFPESENVFINNTQNLSEHVIGVNTIKW